MEQGELPKALTSNHQDTWTSFPDQGDNKGQSNGIDDNDNNGYDTQDLWVGWIMEHHVAIYSDDDDDDGDEFDDDDEFNDDDDNVTTFHLKYSLESQ